MKKQTDDLEEMLFAYTEIAVECSVLGVCFLFDVGRSSFFMSFFVFSYLRVFVMGFE